MRTAEIVALGAGVLSAALILLPKKDAQEKPEPRQLIWSVGGCLALWVLGALLPDKALGDGLKMAALCGLVPFCLKCWNGSARATSALAFAAGAYGAYLVRNPADPSTHPALLGAAGLAVLALALKQDASAAIGMLLSSCTILFWKFMGSADPRGFGLVALIMAPAVAALVFAVAEKWMAAQKQLPLILATLAIAVAGFIGSSKLLTSLDFRWCPAVGAILALLVVLLTEGENNTTQRRMLSAAILVASGMFAFSLGRMPGVAVAAGASAVVFALGGRAMLSLIAVPVALVLLRSIRIESQTSRMTLEMGPYQTLMGIMVGVVAIALAWEVLRSSSGSDAKGKLAALILGLLVVGAAAATPVFLNDRAVPGVFLGLCLGALLALRDTDSSDRPATLAIAGAAGLYGLYPALLPFMDLVRDEKVKILAVATVLGAGLAAVAVWLLREAPRTAAEEGVTS